MFHHFQTPIEDIRLPRDFTFPFDYVPHPLCVKAAEEVQAYLAQQTAWQEELQRGKMFGVLVVRTQEEEVGYLAAFSGLLDGKSVQPFFVPPVYDLTQPQGFFKEEEAVISDINRRIAELEYNKEYIEQTEQLSQTIASATEALESLKAEMKAAKAVRDGKRKAGIDEQEAAALIRESQFQKAEYKRQERAWKERIAAQQIAVDEWNSRIAELKTERKTRSAALQQRLFSQFRLLNRKGEVKDLCEIFSQTAHKVPPAGAGECAAPKLLQYAYLHDWKPICMAEFWWGDSPKDEVRHHGNYYPACRGKCEPILSHMLRGLKVDENPMLKHTHTPLAQPLEIVYEDDSILVINKPIQLLSIPSKDDSLSVYRLMREQLPDRNVPIMVHRLDFATSGLLIITKTKTANLELQRQFTERLIKKRYVALLDGIVPNDRGTVSLPLCKNIIDQPRQMVSEEYGKPSVTDYEVLSRDYENRRTRIAFYPHTGRTHQLRVHAAHPLGLNCPIVGDDLYGTRSDRLYLHAQSIEFTHPATGKPMRITKEPDF